MNLTLPTPIDFETTIAAAGDTFDILALDYYNNELLSSLIIFYNRKLADVIIFEEPTEVTIPVIEKEDLSVLPVWRKNEIFD